MARCEDCQQEMTTADGCTADALRIDGTVHARFRVGRRDTADGRCHDCGARVSHHHHLGCDMEQCPRCRRQLLSCGCAWYQPEPAEDETVYPDPVYVLEVVSTGARAGARTP